MPAQLDQRRILHGSAFFIESLILPVDLHVGIGAMFQELFRQFQRGHVAAWRRRSVGRIADACSAIRAGFSQPGQGVQGRTARIGRIRVGAVVQQNGGEFEVGIDDGHVQRTRAVRRGIADIGAAFEQNLNRIDVPVPHRK